MNSKGQRLKTASRNFSLWPASFNFARRPATDLQTPLTRQNLPKGNLMSDKTRKKKDGEDQNKAAERMHKAEKISHDNPGDRSAYVKNQESHEKTALEQLDRDDFDKDLRPNEMAGENHGADTAQNEKNVASAYEYKELHGQFPQLSSADLKNIPILTAGTRLDQGATYLDLMNLEKGEYSAVSNETVGENDRIVPKTGVDYPLWNRLTGNEH